MNCVLVVDDNTAVRHVLADFLLLNFPQLRILQAEDGIQGLFLAQTEKPDLILLDAEMPHMDGFQVAQTLRNAPETKEIPIIAISSASKENRIAIGLRAIANASLPKPFSADELLQIVTKVIPP